MPVIEFSRIVKSTGTVKDIALKSGLPGQGSVAFTAEQDASATSPGFKAKLGPIHGWIHAISVRTHQEFTTFRNNSTLEDPDTGSDPTGAFQLDLKDSAGRTYSYAAIPAAGSDDITNGGILDPFSDEITIEIDDMGASKAVRVTVYVKDSPPLTARITATSPMLVGTTSNGIELDASDGTITPTGTASPLSITNLQTDDWFPSQTGEFSAGKYNKQANASISVAADFIYAVPVYLSRAGEYDALEVSVTTSQAASTARLGIYADNGSGEPGALIEDTGTFATTSTGFKTVALAADRTLDPGLFWLVYFGDTTSVVLRASNHDDAYAICSIQSGSDHLSISVLLHSLAFAVLPDPFGTTIRTVTSSPPRIVLRAA